MFQWLIFKRTVTITNTLRSFYHNAPCRRHKYLYIYIFTYSKILSIRYIYTPRVSNVHFMANFAALCICLFNYVSSHNANLCSFDGLLNLDTALLYRELCHGSDLNVTVDGICFKLVRNAWKWFYIDYLSPIKYIREAPYKQSIVFYTNTAISPITRLWGALI